MAFIASLWSVTGHSQENSYPLSARTTILEPGSPIRSTYLLPEPDENLAPSQTAGILRWWNRSSEPEFFPYILLSAVNIAAVYSTKLCFWQQKNSGSGEEIRKQHLQCAKKRVLSGRSGYTGVWLQDAPTGTKIQFIFIKAEQQMKEASRVQAVIEALEEILQDKRPADNILDKYFKDRRYIGSKDRRFIADTVWKIIRSRMKYSEALGSAFRRGRRRRSVLPKKTLTSFSTERNTPRHRSAKRKKRL